MPYKTIDLCAGIGGIRRGFELAGDFQNVISAEIDELACTTYEHLFSLSLIRMKSTSGEAATKNFSPESTD